MTDDSEEVSDRETRLFLIFKDAIESERAAQARYQEAVEYCDDPELRTILQAIRCEEAHHEQALVGWYEALKMRIKDKQISS